MPRRAVPAFRIVTVVAVMLAAHFGLLVAAARLGLERGAATDALEIVLLGMIAAPVLYGVVLRPMHRARAEQERAERELRDSEQRHRVMLDLAPDAIVVHCGGRFVYVNEAAARMVGAPSAGSLLGRSIVEFVHPEDRALVQERIRQMVEEGRIAPLALERFLRLDGSVVHVEVRAGVIRHGAEPAVFVVVRDVSERRAVEERVRIQATALEAVANGVMVLDREGRIERVNPAMARALGCAPEALAGRAPGSLRAEPDEGKDAAVWATLRRGEAWRGECSYRRADGSTLTMAQTITPVRDEHGEIAQYVAVAHDVTEQRSLEYQLRQALKMEAVGQLAGGIAHDFNNLLTTVLASAGLLEERVADDPGAAEEAQLIRRSAERGAALTRKLLAFGRRQQLEVRALNLVELIGDFSRMIRRVLREDIVVELALRDPAWVNADPGALEQILMNLATNARDAMPSGGRFVISAGQESLEGDAAVRAGLPAPGDYVVVRARDSGVGMEPETVRRVFEPFFTTKDVGSGTGLGMSMVYGLVAQLGGRIEVESELGAGTTVTLYFPAVPAPRRAADVPEERRAHGGTETILVVEDEPGLRRAAHRVLEKHGYTVLLAENGEQALGSLANTNGEVKLVITDVVMPQMGGPELYRAIRGLGKRVPVLFTSGYSQRDTEAEASLRGQPFLHKPWTVSELLGRVREVLDGAPARRP